MTRTQKAKRRALLISELSRMSRDWGKYTAADWQPLEAELAGLS